MAYDFMLGKFLNGEGLHTALSRGIEPVHEAAVKQWMKFSRAFSAGGHHKHGGQRWQPLAESTVRRKGHPTILIDSGVLRTSITFKTIRALPDGFIVDLGTNVPYARYHQEGRGVPQRKVVEVTEQDRRELTAGFLVWMERALNGNNLNGNG